MTLLLLTLALGQIAVPWWAARDPSPRRGLARALLGLVAFNVTYAVALRFLFFRWG